MTYVSSYLDPQFWFLEYLTTLFQLQSLENVEWQGKVFMNGT
jgi:hypothetical protein